MGIASKWFIVSLSLVPFLRVIHKFIKISGLFYKKQSKQKLNQTQLRPHLALHGKGTTCSIFIFSIYENVHTNYLQRPFISIFLSQKHMWSIPHIGYNVFKIY